jgi:glutathione synthase
MGYASRAMRFVYVMDPMARILPDKDTTFALQRATQRRGHLSLHCEPRDIYVQEGDVWARARELSVRDSAPFFEFKTPADVRLADCECVLVR